MHPFLPPSRKMTPHFRQRSVSLLRFSGVPSGALLEVQPMKRISAVALLSLGIGILACGGGDEGTTTTDQGGDEVTDDGSSDDVADDSVELPETSLTDPWKSMNLPVGDGTVVVSDSSVLLVGYQDDSTVKSLTNDYRSAIAADGWTQTEDYSTSEFTAILYEKDKQQIGFAAGVEEGITFAYMEDLGKVAKEESAIAAAKKGTPRIGRARKYGRGSGRKGRATPRKTQRKHR